MNSKLTLPDLIAALSGSANVSRAVSERFIKSLFSIIAEAAVNGENVKIKGLGTFKISDVEERKSVNVNTGAEMIIPAHRKISFSPDKALSEKINAPFSLFEPVELDDEVSEQMLAEADEEPERPASVPEEDAAPAPDAADMEEVAEKPAAPAQPSEDEFAGMPPMHEFDAEPAQESPELSASQEADEADEPASEEEKEAPGAPEDDNIEAPATNEEKEPAEERAECKTQNIETETEEIITDDKKVEIHVHSPECHAPRFRRGIYIGMIAAAAVMLVVIAGWRLLLPDSFCMVTRTVLPPSQSELIADKAVPATPVDTAAAAPAPRHDTLPADEAIKPVAATADNADEDAAPTKASDSQEVKEPKKVYDTITRKRFLTTMAKEHYGDYNLWPFIYDENRDRLGHPDRIKPGTKVVIPPASKYHIDAKDPKCVARAKKRGAEIYARYR